MYCLTPRNHQRRPLNFFPFFSRYNLFSWFIVSYVNREDDKNSSNHIIINISHFFTTHLYFHNTMTILDLGRIHSNNVSTLRRSPFAEISGSLGDLGTLLPLMIALALQGSISLSTTLVFSGLWNIMTGMVFGIPLPVQPMKVCQG
jgi:hypothetical protein